jgi:broad specificity phosphatase PhoE
LNEEGKFQAAKAADFLARFPIQHIYASPMERTMETAAIIAGRHALPIVQVDFLKEVNFGDFQGKGQELLQNPTWQAFHTTPSQVRFPAGESVQEAQRRVVQGVDDLVRTHTGTEEIVCVAHCEILRLALAHALAMPLDAFMRLTIDTASVSKIEWDPAQQRVHFLNYIP